MPSVFRGSDNFDTAGGNAVKAWVNFNGTTSPGTIRASFNVSSITKNGTGDYTVNFTNAMPDANYAANVSTQTPGAGAANFIFSSAFNSAANPSASAFRISVWRTDNGVGIDPSYVCASIFR
jgi:hypothetical protein